MKIIWTKEYLKYDFGKGHPFKARRALPFLEKIKESGINYEVIAPKEATDTELLLVHTQDYLDRVKKLAKEGGSLSVDTPLNENILRAARFSVGGSILALNLALKDERAMNLF